MNVVSLPRLCLYYLIFDAKPNVLPCTEIERIYTTCCEILQDVLLGKFSICTISLRRKQGIITKRRHGGKNTKHNVRKDGYM